MSNTGQDIKVGSFYLLNDLKTVIEVTEVGNKGVTVVFEIPCDCGILGCKKQKRNKISKTHLNIYQPIVK